MVQKKVSRFGPGAFRLFLASVVVVHHTFPLRLGSWAVYVFFTLSGYWICYMWKNKYQRTMNPLLTFYVSRWCRLAPVFITCTILGVLSSRILQLVSHTAQNQSYGIGWWLRQILIVGSASDRRVLPPSWSLDVEMQFYLLAPLILILLPFIPIKGRFLAALSGILYLTFQLVRGTSADTPRLDLYLGCFLVGIWLQQSQWRPRVIIARASLVTFFGLTFVFLLLPLTRSGIWVRGEEAAAISSVLPGWPHIWWALGALVVLPFVAFNVGQPSPARDRWLGNLAYPLYLFHWITRDWYYKYVDWSQPLARNLLLLALSWGAALLGAVVILVMIDQPCDKIRARWVEKRCLLPDAASKPAPRPLPRP